MPTANSLSHTLQRLLFASVPFAESEELREFQYKFLLALMVAGALFTALLLLGHASGLNDLSGPHLRSMKVFTLLALACWWVLRGHPGRFLAVAWIYEGVCMLEYGSALMFVPEDELRLLWFLVNVPGVFILLGPRSGWAITALSLLMLLGLNPVLAHPYSVKAQATLVLALLYLSVMFHVFGQRSVSYFSRMRRYNRKLLQIASHDALTGVLNARAYQAHCQSAIEIGAARGQGYAVLFVDLDHFKRVNDEHGHAAGDLVLKAAARALRQGVRRSDTVGRIGGEEFAVFLPEAGLTEALQVTEGLRQRIEQMSVEVDGQALHITASIGVADCPSGRTALLELQQQADTAMYQVKAAGRNRVTALHGLA